MFFYREYHNISIDALIKLYDFIWKSKVDLLNFFMSSSTKKLRTPEHSSFEIIQLLFEAIFNIMNNNTNTCKPKHN